MWVYLHNEEIEKTLPMFDESRTAKLIACERNLVEA
jgi:hypothetical protein